MIFWQHIKGMYELTNQQTSSDNKPLLYTWIQFQPKNSSTWTDQSNLPNIQVWDTITADWKDCGHILTSKGTQQHLYGVGLTFKNANGTGDQNTYIDYAKIQCVQSDAASVVIDNTDSYGQLAIQSTSLNPGMRLIKGNKRTTGNQVVVHSSGTDINFWFGGVSTEDNNRNFWKYDASSHTNTILGTLSVIANSSYGVNTAAIQSTGYIYAGSSTTHTTAGDISGTNLYAGTKCEASYFNATSDRRAKTNIQPLLIDALELVRKTQLYSFKYKETDTPSIGIIAQDVQNVDINGFKLVDNEEATGKDLDYMTIHESKLTYILWKAVQEQQDMIEKLKHEIEELKKN